MWWIEIRFETDYWKIGCIDDEGSMAVVVVVAAAAAVAEKANIAVADTPKICWISRMKPNCVIDWKLSKQLNLSDRLDPHCWI